MKEENAKGKRPDMIAYNVQGQDGQSYWNKVGAAWKHKDGAGYDIALDSMPVGGRVTLRKLREDRLQSYEDERSAQHDNAQNHDMNRNRERAR